VREVWTIVILAAAVLASHAYSMVQDYPWTSKTSYSPDNQVPGSYFNLGPTGIRAKLNSLDFQVMYVFPGSPAAGQIQAGDYIIGVNGRPFTTAFTFGFPPEYARTGGKGPPLDFGMAIEESESKDGILKLTVRRGTSTFDVSLTLRTLGKFTSTWPYHCPKSNTLLQEICASLAAKQYADGGWAGGLHVTAAAALTLLGSGDAKYATNIQRAANNIIQNLNPTDPGSLNNWNLTYGGIFLSEYYMATKDANALTGLKKVDEGLVFAQLADGKYQHQKNWGGYDELGVMNGLVLMTWGLMKQTQAATVSQIYMDKTLARVIYNTASDGNVAYGGSGASWGPMDTDLGRTGAGVMGINFVNSDGSRDAYVFRGSKYLGDHQHYFPDCHGSQGVGMQWAALAAARNTSDLRKILDNHVWFINMARCVEPGQYVAQPSRAGSAGTDYWYVGREWQSATIGLMLCLKDRKLAITRYRVPDVNPAAPSATISVSDGVAGETGPDSGSFTIQLSAAAAAPITINYAISGSAANGTDYAALQSSITIPAGVTSSVIKITPVDDSMYEGDETVTLTLSTGTGYVLGTSKSATITIKDNDSPPPPGNGTGLLGEYFDNMDFTALKFSRTDASVNFNWGTSSPASSMGADSFSIRWSGEVLAQFSQTYTFYANTDDGVRLWVNGQLIIDKWIDQAATEWSGSIALTAGQRYKLKMEFYENGGYASAKLAWSSASTPKAIIPASQLFPAQPNRAPIVSSGATATPNPATTDQLVQFSVAASDADGDALSYLWNFGDGASATGSTVTHSYGAAGTYTANVRVDDGSGGQVTSSITVTVNTPPPAFAINVNFQLAGAPVPAGYVADSGKTFGDRGNGYTYGWNIDIANTGRDRNAANSPDQRYDTFLHMQKTSPNGVWEIAVPNGTYRVRAVCGDPSYFDSDYKLTVEGILTVSGTPNSTVRWYSGVQDVSVSDGRLTVSSAAGAINNKLCFIEISTISSRSLAEAPLVAEPVEVRLYSLSINYRSKNKDSYTVSGYLPTLAQDFSPKDVLASVDAGAAIANFKLNARGRARSANGSFSLKFNKAKGWSFKASIRRGTWSHVWEDGGLFNTETKQTLDLPLTLTLGSQAFGGSKRVTFIANGGASAKAK